MVQAAWVIGGLAVGFLVMKGALALIAWIEKIETKNK
jgi:hypothetical protein